MSARDNIRWREWADNLRQQMMQDLTAQITKTVDSIVAEIGTDRSPVVLRSARFWNSYHTGKSPHDIFPRAGLELEFQANDKAQIDLITIRLNRTWRAIMQRVLDRQPLSDGTAIDGAATDGDTTQGANMDELSTNATSRETATREVVSAQRAESSHE